jgi:hypothetical protein
MYLIVFHTLHAGQPKKGHWLRVEQPRDVYLFKPLIQVPVVAEGNHT